MSNRVRCATCGEEHDLSDLEPGYRLPDAYFAVPEGERAHRTNFSRGQGRIRDAEDTERRHFLRVLLPIPVRGERRNCSWGVWVEVSGPAWQLTYDRWDDPVQHEEPPFPGTLANSLKGYDGTLGLPGLVQLTGPTTPPRFVLDRGVEHPLVRDQREGVYPERVVEWLTAHVH
jgi:hypothetical protein